MKNNNFRLSIFRNNLRARPTQVSQALEPKSNSKANIISNKRNDVGNPKYFIPFSKEWNNTIYTYNNNSLKFLPINNIKLNFLIKSYFNMYFNSFTKKIQNFCRIFVSKPEFKFTNKQVIITVYTYNKEKLALLETINAIKEDFFVQSMINLKSWLSKINKRTAANSPEFLFFLENSVASNVQYSFNGLLNKRILKILLSRELLIVQELKTIYNVNKYKFEEIFLYRLSGLISSIFRKKVSFNIINLKSFTFNSDLFTEMVTLKLKKQNTSLGYILSFILNKVRLPKENTVLEKLGTTKGVDYGLIENRYKNIYLNSILNNSDFKNEKLWLRSNWEREHTPISEENNHISEIIFNNIKYKNMGGVRIEVKGRLTRRFKAEKSMFKLKWKGGLQNLDSSFKGLSSSNIRGYLKPNVQYTLLQSKRPVGAFAAKGWVSGK